MIKIAPSLLAADTSCLRNEIADVEHAGVDWLHVDVMDGHFVPNITFGPHVVESIRPYTKLFLDVHLMIQSPDRYIEAFAKSGADLISVHQEVCPHLHRTIASIKEYGVKAGVVINPATPVGLIEPILPDVDLVLLMTVNPGFGGQRYIPGSENKVAHLKKLLQSHPSNSVEIEVDGGIDAQTAQAVVQSGATVLVAGSYIFSAKDRKEAVDRLRQAGNG